MKVPLGIDLDALDHGPATPGLRTVLRGWSDIDWFAPGDPDAAAEGFADHLRRAHRHAADEFPLAARVEAVRGDWDDLVELCLSVRERTGWDWKYTALKPMTSAHLRARGWVWGQQPAPPGGLWIGLADTNIWTLPGPEAALAAVPEPAREQAGFYLGYARFDLISCLEWQLADGHDELSDNPFVPLLATYAAGGFPFAMANDEYVLFDLIFG